MADLMNTAARSLWYILPSYVANMTPVLLGGGKPLDLNRRFVDGRRILGEHKTVRGFLSGVITGTLVGCLQGRPVSGFLLALGAMIGDAFGSFLKRRMGLKRGEPMPVLDQLGFLAASLLLASLIYGAPGWMRVEVILALALITALLHVGTNAAAYLLGLKDKPY